MGRFIDMIVRTESGITRCGGCGSDHGNVLYNGQVLCVSCGRREKVELSTIKVKCLTCQTNTIDLESKVCTTCGSTVEMRERATMTKK